MTIPIILAIAEIFGLFAIGAAARLSGYITDKEIDRWSRLVLDFLLPAYTFTTIVRGLDRTRLYQLWPLPLLGLGLLLFFTIGGYLLRFGLFTTDGNIRKSFVHFCVANNSLYLPIIIIRNLWGESALANLFLFNIGTTIGVWTIGIAVLGSNGNKINIKNIITPNLIAILVAVVLTTLGVTSSIPTIVIRVLSSAGSAAVPLILILIGASLAHRDAVIISWHLAYISIVRLLILPAGAIFLLRLLPLPKDLFSVAVIVALMPVAVATVIMTRRYGGSPHYATSAALVTTILSVITVPVALFFLFR